MDRDAIIGIDTSNYTTSVALISGKEILADERRLLRVKDGERGLRQSEALFQHVQMLPVLIESAMKDFLGRITAVSVASRPRPVEGSYMPVFTVGQSVGRSLAATLSVPYYEYSHQEGHIAAIRPEGWEDFQCLHMSGGTSELLAVKGNQIEIIGGTKDISLGQLLDRVGVAMGLSFPAGKAMDDMALAHEPTKMLKPIAVDGNWINLSGMESQCQRELQKGQDAGPLAAEIFHHMAKAIVEICGGERTLLVGGVSSSRTLRRLLKDRTNITIPEGNLASDNAVGIALLGGDKYGRKGCQCITAE